MAGIWIKNANVNGGNAIYVNGSFTYASKSMAKIEPVIAKTAADGKPDIDEASLGGIENPTITLTGVFDTNNYDSNDMSPVYIIQLWRERTADTYLMITVGESDYSIPDYNGTQPTDWSNAIKVVLTGFEFSGDQTSVKSHLIRYRLTFRITK